jgi:hypothetical protein
MGKQPGVLYVRYDKNSPCGRLIERLKRDNKYNLNQKILDLLFLTEIPEAVQNKEDTLTFDLDEYSDKCYEALKFFTRKLALVKYQIDALTARSVANYTYQQTIVKSKSEVSSIFDRTN